MQAAPRGTRAQEEPSVGPDTPRAGLAGSLPRGPILLTGVAGGAVSAWATVLRDAGVDIGTAIGDARESDGTWARDGAFVAWSQSILWRDSGDDVLPAVPPRPRPSDVDRLRALVDEKRRATTSPWGVCDPRIGYLAEAWLTACPDARLFAWFDSPGLAVEMLDRVARFRDGGFGARLRLMRCARMAAGSLLRAKRRFPERVTLAGVDDDGMGAQRRELSALVGLELSAPSLSGLRTPASPERSASDPVSLRLADLAYRGVLRAFGRAR